MQRETLERRRQIEDQAVKLGAERRELQESLRDNRRAISALLEVAVADGIPVEHFAQLVGVTRASLYRWRGTTEMNE